MVGATHGRGAAAPRGFPTGTGLILGQTHGRPTRLTPEYARSAIRSLGTCPGFDAVLRATAGRRAEGFTAIDVPVTIAFGSRDRLLLPGQSRHLDLLPPDTRTATLPGCGHIPIADDPDAVAALILGRAATLHRWSSRRGASASRRRLARAASSFCASAGTSLRTAANAASPST